jgi:hypothetical protein
MPENLDPIWIDFTRQQSAQFLKGLYESLRSFWISCPGAIQRAEFKPYQLWVAEQHKLKIPRTLITNDPEQVRDFLRGSKKKIVYKPLLPPMPVVPKTANNQKVPLVLYTTVLQENHIESIDLIRLSPGIFQEYVDKSIEIRITIFGRRVFAAEIHSQTCPETLDDWRWFPDKTPDLPHFPHRLPRDLENTLCDLTAYLGLQFGAIDMILTPDGEYVFLEINPNGQWLWVQDLTDMPLLETLCDMLVTGQPAAMAAE